MPLTNAQVATINNTISRQLESVGEQLCPPSSKNTETVAWNYYIATKMESFAKALKTKRVKEACVAGVMFDHTKEPLDDGTTKDVFTGDVVRISVAVKSGAVSFDVPKLCALLSAAGVKKAVLDKALEGSKKQARGAHTFTAVLLSDGQD